MNLPLDKNKKLEANQTNEVIVYALLGRLGQKSNLNQVREAISASPQRTPLGYASDALRGFGFLCSIGKVRISEINALTNSGLLLGKNGELAILEKAKENKFIIYGSREGRKNTLSEKDFRDWYSGKAIHVQPNSKDHKGIKSRLKALSPLRVLGAVRFTWVAIAALLSNILGLSTSLFIMVVYDRVLPNQAVQSLYALAVGVGFAILFDSILKGARSRIIEKASVNADNSVNEDIFDQFIEVSKTKDRKSVGELSVIMRDFEIYRDFMSSATILTLIDLPFVLIFVAVIYMVGGPLFLIPLICIPTILIGITVIQPVLARNSAAVSTAFQSRQGLLVEILGGLEAIRVNGGFALMKRKFLISSGQYAKATHQAKNYSQINGNTISIVQQIAQVAIVVYGFHLYQDQIITMGAIIATVILSGRALTPLAKVGQTLGRANAARIARKNLVEFLSTARASNDGLSSVIRNTDRLSIEVSNATLRLAEMGQPLFNGLNLSIKTGEKVAIVGRTGSGKTSLIKLVVGLLEPETGSVMINGSDVRQFSRADLFRTIGTVFQEPWLFSGTLRDNVGLGQQDCSDEAIISALKASGADFVGNSSSDLDFRVQDQGKNLSGGQKQSIMMARALAFFPQLLILDEPSSAMDAVTESRLITHLKQSEASQTLLIVTHKMTLVDVCDRVVVLDKGKIIGDGTKEAYFKLLKKNSEKRL